MKKLNFKKLALLLMISAMCFNAEAQFNGLKKLKDKVTGGDGKSKGKEMSFEKVWSAKTSSSATVYSCASPEGSYALTTSRTDMALIDGESGEQLWYGKFKEVTDKGITNSNYQFVLWEANTLLVFDSKMGKNDRIAGINLADGSLMWILDSYQIPKKTIEDLISYIPEMKAFAFSMPSKTIMVDVKSGEELWVTEDFKGAIGRHVYLPDSKELVVINFMRNEYDALATGLGAGNINTIAKIDISNGDVVWKSTHKGFGGKKFITKERQGTLEVQGNKILVIYNGIQVFDLASGENIWDAYYNESIKILKQPAGVKSGLNMGGGKTGGLQGETYDAIAEPLITEDHVYVVLQEKDKKVRRKYIRKYELSTGKMIWETERINDAKALPRLELVGNTVVAQIGGLVNQQYKGLFKDVSSGREQWRWVNEYVWVGKFGLRGFDTSSGKVTWESDKFKARITRMAVDNGNVFAASAKYFYSIDAASGKENYQVDFKATKVGKPKFSFDIGEAVTIIGDKGVTAFNKADGSALYSSEKIKNIVTYYTKEGKLYMQDKRDDLIQLDLSSGETLGTVRVPKHNSEKKTLAQMTVGGKGNEEQFARVRELSGGADITEDGNYIYVFDGVNVSKYKTN